MRRRRCGPGSRRARRAGCCSGRRRTGLLNDDVALADTVLTVPLNPGFSSLNLAQAVLIVGYEWFPSGVIAPSEILRRGGSRPATKAVFQASSPDRSARGKRGVRDVGGKPSPPRAAGAFALWRDITNMACRLS
jgi:hypothetical protein